MDIIYMQSWKQFALPVRGGRLLGTNEYLVVYQMTQIMER